MTYYYYKIKNMNVSFISAPNAVHQHYPIQPAGIGGGSNPQPDNDYFKLRNTGETDGTLTVKKYNHPDTVQYRLDLEYSTDGENWTACEFTSTTATTDVFSVAVPKGTYVCFRGDNVRGITADNYSAWTMFAMDVPHVAEGKLTTLISKESYSEVTSLYRYAFNGMFREDANLLSAENLSFDNVTTLNSDSNSGAVQSMFALCTSLTTPPDMSGITDAAGTISPSNAWRTFRGMFAGCTSLTEPAKIYNVTAALGTTDGLGYGAFNSMYNGCSNLSYAYTPNVPISNANVYDGFLYNAGTAVTGDKIIYCPTQEVLDAFPVAKVPSGWTLQVMQ